MTTLSDFSVQPTKAQKARAAWTPLDAKVPGDNTTVLCFDQTLAKTGWSVLKVVNGEAMVWDTGVYEDAGDTTGFRDDYGRGRRMFLRYLDLIERYLPLLVLHETPSTGIKGRTTSSLLAGMAVNCASENVGLPVDMFQAQHVRLILCNDAKATKAQVKDAVLAIWPDLAERAKTNKLRISQDVTDSIAGGLVWMKEHR